MNSKFFEYKERENIISQTWEKKKIYKAHEGKGLSFKIDTPPPTVSGELHMGHVFSYVQADIIARFKRMQGYSVFYPIGFDDNGLPTERLVEKLAQKKVGRNSTRDEFIKECHKIVDKSEKEFEEMFKKIGLSVDFDLKYQTISSTTSEISQTSFINLYKKGLVYQKLAPVYFDTVDKTALAQADIEDKEIAGYEVVFKARVKGIDDSTSLEIMTTRPEMLPACKAVLFHPDDARYKNLYGKKALLPTIIINEKLEYELEVPFIPDFEVIMDKGTGLVITCAFGDIQDKIWLERHKLEISSNLISEDGRLIDALFTKTSVAPDAKEEHSYMKVSEGRKFIIEKMLQAGLIVGSLPDTELATALSEPHIKLNSIIHYVKCGERSGHPIEILLKNQWYVRVLPFRENLHQVIKKIDFHPAYMKVRLEKWIEGLNQDWCISRERFFGINIPFREWEFLKDPNDISIPDALYLNEMVLAEGGTPIDENRFLATEKQISCIEEKISREREVLKEKGIHSLQIKNSNLVLDTWFTSALTPHIATGFLSSANIFDLRPQAHEIIRTWAFYTILVCYLHSLKLKNNMVEISPTFDLSNFAPQNEEKLNVPWKNVMLSGWCLAADKSKMSKSKGNVITPLNLISEKGTDVLRLWCASSSLGSDTAYSMQALEPGQKFISKLWNAAKFAHSGIKKLIPSAQITESFDKWIMCILHKTLKEYEIYMEKFEYSKAKEVLDTFFWNIFCDNYIEIIKVRYYGLEAIIYRDAPPANPINVIKGQQSAFLALKYIFHAITLLYAPFAPFITEDIYNAIYEDNIGSPHAQGSLKGFTLPYFQEEGELPIKIIEKVRKFKTENMMPLNSAITTFKVGLNSGEALSLSPFLEDLKNVTGVKNFIFS